MVTGSLLSDKRGGILRQAVFLLLFSLSVLVLAWMLFLPGALRAEVESRTGFAMDVETLSCNPFGLTLLAESLSIGNPESFGGGEPMLQIRSIKVYASPSALSRGEIWIDVVEIDIAKAIVVIDERGALNLDTFVERLFANDEVAMPFHAAEIKLAIDELEVVDFSSPSVSKRSIRPMEVFELRDREEAMDLFGPIVELARRVGGIASVEI